MTEHDTRTRRINILVMALIAIGMVVFLVWSPRAGAAIEALDDRETPRTHQLWACPGATTCHPRGRPQNKTACELDAASLASVLPKGSRVTCQRVTR